LHAGVAGKIVTNPPSAATQFDQRTVELSLTNLNRRKRERIMPVEQGFVLLPTESIDMFSLGRGIGK
jgi:hypothetical protein